jgi:hypothetical protein
MPRRMLIAGAVAGAALLAGDPDALAQAVVVQPPPTVSIVPAPPTRYDERYYEFPPAPPRVYRYYRYAPDDDDDLVAVLPRARSGCGPHHYWDGKRCINVRW